MFAIISSIFILLTFNNCYSISNDFIKSNNELAFDLFHTINSEINLFICPITIQTSLWKLLIGSNQQTKQELLSVLQLSADTILKDSDFDDLKELSKSTNDLKLAYKLYISNKYGIKQQFKDRFNAHIESVNFNTNAKNVTKLINKYVAERTDSKIPNLFGDSLPSETKLVLINAIYFNGKWKNGFDSQTEKMEFANFQSNSILDAMKLNSLLKVQPITELNAQIIELPYANNQQILYILLPDDNEGLEGMNEKLTLSLLQQSIQKLNQSKEQQIALFLPKFKIETDYHMRETLEDMGAKTLFTKDADLSGISDDKSLSLSLAIHHTILEVNENGEKAQPISPQSESREIRVDHPFTFFIYSNGLILFVGQVQALVDEQLLSFGFV